MLEVVEGSALVAVVLVVGGAPGTRTVDVVVVLLVVTVPEAGTGHAAGAGAWRAANFPGSSRRTSPPKSRQ